MGPCGEISHGSWRLATDSRQKWWDTLFDFEVPTAGMDSVVLGATHPEELESFESLSWDHSNQLHFAKKCNFGRR